MSFMNHSISSWSWAFLPERSSTPSSMFFAGVLSQVPRSSYGTAGTARAMFRASTLESGQGFAARRRTVGWSGPIRLGASRQRHGQHTRAFRISQRFRVREQRRGAPWQSMDLYSFIGPPNCMNAREYFKRGLSGEKPRSKKKSRKGLRCSWAWKRASAAARSSFHACGLAGPVPSPRHMMSANSSDSASLASSSAELAQLPLA